MLPLRATNVLLHRGGCAPIYAQLTYRIDRTPLGEATRSRPFGDARVDGRYRGLSYTNLGCFFFFLFAQLTISQLSKAIKKARVRWSPAVDWPPACRAASITLMVFVNHKFVKHIPPRPQFTSTALWKGKWRKRQELTSVLSSRDRDRQGGWRSFCTILAYSFSHSHSLSLSLLFGRGEGDVPIPKRFQSRK